MIARNATLSDKHPGVLFVASNSHPVDVGSSIAHLFRQQGRATIQAIGPKAINQAIKALVCATRYLALEDKHIGFIPSFHTTVIAGQERTAIRFEVLTRANCRQ